jgi:Kef-type K+ transport system membrane component KefB
VAEESFILVEVARKSGMVGDEIFTATLAASLISIFLKVFIVRGLLKWVEPQIPDAERAIA